MVSTNSSSNGILDLEMPNSIISKLIKDGLSEEGSVILSKDVKKAFSQIAGLFALYLNSTYAFILSYHTFSPSS